MILETANGPLYFQVWGQGPPLVFVSGWALSCESWRPAVNILKASHRCLIYDARGVARSQPARVDASFAVEDHSEDLHALLSHAKIFDATFIGHEMGACVAAHCAQMHPQCFDSLIVVSPRPPIAEKDVRRLALYTPASLAMRELAAYPLLRNLVAWRFRRAPQPFRDKLFEDFADLNPRAAYETALSGLDPDSTRWLDHLLDRGGPSLIICGDKDRKGLAEARRLFSTARNARLATLKECGFLPMLEYPAQFARLVQRFSALRARPTDLSR
jgi:pimeloyl-ACP methyl ester carboxylesterase